MFIWLDRVICKGRFITAFVVTIGILSVPIIAGAIHHGYKSSPSPCCQSASDETSIFMDAFESYLNPSFSRSDPQSIRSYRLLIGYLGAFLLNGLLVSLVVTWFQRRRERWENGEIHYYNWQLKNFAVIIGGNEMVPNIVSQLLNEERREKKLDYIIIMTNRDVSSLRKKLVSSLGKREAQVVIVYGERTSYDDLKNLRLSYTKNDIYIIGEQLDIEQNGSHHDVKNMECVQQIAKLLKSKGCKKNKTCRVMFEYQSTFSVFQFANICKNISSVIDFKPFNYYETWAQKVFVRQTLSPSNLDDYLPLEGLKPITAECDDTVHLIVIGMSRMGIAMAVEAAHLAHYPNYIKKNKLSRITFIDSDAQREMNFFQGHYRELFSVSRWRYIEAQQDNKFYDGECDVDQTPWIDSHVNEQNSPYRDCDGYTIGTNIVDVEWQFIKGNLEMPSVQRFIRAESKNSNNRITIAICFPRDNASLAASLYLPDEVYDAGSCVQRVLVYQPFGDAMMESFEKDEKKNEMKSYKFFSKLRAFGMIDSCYDLNFQETIDSVSRTIGDTYDEVTKKNKEAFKMTRRNFREKVSSQWTKPEAVGKTFAAKQWSNLYNGQHMWTKLRSVGFACGDNFDKDTIDMLSKVEHVRWNVEQLLLGYAPLNASEQIDLVKKHGNKKPEVKLDDKGETVLNIEEVSKWLQSWEEFDSMREILKSNMSHVDICSYDRLQDVDSDAMIYDRELVRILPTIYSNICPKQKN